MEKIITKAMSLDAGGPSHQKVIERLKDQIERGQPGKDAKGKMFQFFQDLIGKKKLPTFPCGLHAEMLLGTVRLAPLEEITHGINDECLREICNVC